MAHSGSLRDYRFKDDIDDVRGADLYGRNDKKIGEIKDVIFDHTTGVIQYVVVDAGGWLSTQLFLVPASAIHEREGHDDDFATSLTEEQVKTFPEYNERALEDEKSWRDYETRYQAKWDEDPVLHKEGSFNVITPEPDEMPPAGSSGATGEDVTPTRLAGKFPDTAPNPDKTRLRPSGSASRTEDSRVPGVARGAETPIEASTSRSGASDMELERSISGDKIGYGDVNRTAVPGSSPDLPPSYRETRDDALDASNDLNRPYPVQQGRHRRFSTFEENLRRNRADVISRCGVCGTARDKVA